MFSNRSIPYVFIPYLNGNKKKCAVEETYSILSGVKGSIYVQESRNSFWDHIEDERRFNFDTLLVFAHPHINRIDSLHVLPGNPDYIDQDWWYGQSTKNLSVFYGHICNGSKVLDQLGWRNIFSKWVSYSAKIHSYLGSSKSSKLFRKFIKSVEQVALKKNSPRAMCLSIESIYLDQMSDIIENYDSKSGDAIRLMVLERAKNSLVHS